jgi:hypothetical protein
MTPYKRSSSRVLKKSFLDGLQGLKPHSDVGNGPLMSRLKPRPTRLTAFFSTLLGNVSPPLLDAGAILCPRKVFIRVHIAFLLFIPGFAGRRYSSKIHKPGQAGCSIFVPEFSYRRGSYGTHSYPARPVRGPRPD